MKNPKRSACNVLRTEVVDPGDEQRLWSARQSFFSNRLPVMAAAAPAEDLKLLVWPDPTHFQAWPRYGIE